MDDSDNDNKAPRAAVTAAARAMFPSEPAEARGLAQALEARRDQLSHALRACALDMLAEMAQRHPFICDIQLYFKEDTHEMGGYMGVAGKSGAAHILTNILYDKQDLEKKRATGAAHSWSEEPKRLAAREDCSELALADLEEAQGVFCAARDIFLRAAEPDFDSAQWIRSRHGEPSAAGLARAFGHGELAAGIEAAQIERAAGAASPRPSKPRSL